MRLIIMDMIYNGDIRDFEITTIIRPNRIGRLFGRKDLTIVWVGDCTVWIDKFTGCMARTLVSEKLYRTWSRRGYRIKNEYFANN